MPRSLPPPCQVPNPIQRMSKMNRWSPALLAALALAAPAAAQTARRARPPAPRTPAPSEGPGGFARSRGRGTRSRAGAAGPRDWQQWADDRIRATVDPAAKTLTGSETVTYHNQSPDTL